mgnify:CR=1 FL=1
MRLFRLPGFSFLDLAAVLERQLDLVVARGARSHERADAELGEACLACRFFGLLRLSRDDLAL